ncbi:hypothetical protein [Clostridium sp. CF012]|uniref:hypothetical protein n=1 Tax=Clostridium sp. CF012 TaxID=2843319 RepID=UPI001C0D97F8|nr:hypothetical protein [Clostridium sp. CF012]MBU3143350.1 hypothetical protein [Clostridium sp. CF012]
MLDSITKIYITEEGKITLNTKLGFVDAGLNMLEWMLEKERQGIFLNYIGVAKRLKIIY